jgi:hypothetical protein
VDVKKELIEEKGIAEEAADKLGFFVSLNGIFITEKKSNNILFE